MFYVLKSSDVLDILVPILYYLNDARADQCKYMAWSNFTAVQIMYMCKDFKQNYHFSCSKLLMRVFIVIITGDTTLSKLKKSFVYLSFINQVCCKIIMKCQRTSASITSLFDIGNPGHWEIECSGLVVK